MSGKIVNVNGVLHHMINTQSIEIKKSTSTQTERQKCFVIIELNLSFAP